MPYSQIRPSFKKACCNYLRTVYLNDGSRYNILSLSVTDEEYTRDGMISRREGPAIRHNDYWPVFIVSGAADNAPYSDMVGEVFFHEDFHDSLTDDEREFILRSIRAQLAYRRYTEMDLVAIQQGSHVIDGIHAVYKLYGCLMRRRVRTSASSAVIQAGERKWWCRWVMRYYVWRLSLARIWNLMVNGRFASSEKGLVA